MGQGVIYGYKLTDEVFAFSEGLDNLISHGIINRITLMSEMTWRRWLHREICAWTWSRSHMPACQQYHLRGLCPRPQKSVLL